MAPPSTTTGHRPIVLAFVLFLLAVAVFLPSLRNGFLNYDDPTFVTSNAHVVHGFTRAGIAWAWTATDGGSWLPLTWYSHMLDCQVYGLKPWGHHLTSVLLHGLNTALVFWWLYRMTGARWRSFVVAALFGLHPLHIESVAWVAERKDVLSTFFGLLALLAYTENVTRGGWRVTRSGASVPSPATRHPSQYYWLALICFALSLLSKPMYVTLPFVLLLLDYWPLGRMRSAERGVRNFGRLLIEKIPFFVFTILASIATVVAQRHEHAVIHLSKFPFVDRVENAVVAYARYLGKSFWPQDLGIFYPRPGHWPWSLVIGAFFLLAAISLGAWWQRRRWPWVAVGWLWFLGTLVPVIGLVQVGQQAMADRYTYFPGIGLAIALVWTVQALAKSGKQPFAVGAILSIAVIGGCGWLTQRQIGYWRDSETVFRHAIEVTGDNAVAEANLAGALVQNEKIDEAIVHYRRSLAIDPLYPDFHVNFANALLRAGRVDDAVGQYREALDLKPDSADAYYNLGVALYQTGRTNEAMASYRQAVEHDPAFAPAYYNMGVVCFQRGQMAEAVTNYQRALALNPDMVQAYGNLGSALLTMGRAGEAIGYYRKALAINPDKANVHFALSVALYQTGQVTDAIASGQRALQLAEAQGNAALAEAARRQLGVFESSPAPAGTNSLKP